MIVVLSLDAIAIFSGDFFGGKLHILFLVLQKSEQVQGLDQNIEHLPGRISRLIDVLKFAEVI